MVASLPIIAVNIGLDCLSVVRKGPAIIEHLQAKEKTQLVDKDGRMISGGTTSPPHRETPWKKPWGLANDGDLWKHFQAMVLAKSPEAVHLTKVKEHATRQMVEDCLVDGCDQEGTV